MFNLFGKKQQQEKEVSALELPVSNKQYPQVVQDIHNEFFTAGDAILTEATSLLKELETNDLAKGKRLAALGFSKTREAVVAIETENKLSITKEISELVVHYKQRYPFNKFITEDQVKKICEKYGLVCGDTSIYKGFVPEEKLSLIEQFKLDSQDGSLHYSYGFSTLTEAGWLARHSNSSFFENEVKPKNATTIQVEGMKICAPLKDMEVLSGQQVSGYKIQDIPDPVVLQPVRGGYLIVCAWGDEASDKIVVNQTMN